MLPIVLVLLVASSALAAPSVSVSLASINSIAPEYDSGVGHNYGLSSNAWELVDGADSNIYILTIQQVLNDLANQPDDYSKALAISQTMAILGELSTGVPGDACAAANAINTHVAGGDARGYLRQLASNIDSLVQLGTNPNALRYAVGARGNCAGAGRTYQFEAAWDMILDKATPYNIALVNEEYCAAKRLYNAFNVRSNNVGAAVTAAALPPMVEGVLRAVVPIVNVLRIVINGGNASAQAALAKQLLLS